MTKDKTNVLTALKILRKNSSEREGSVFHMQGMQVASRLTPEIFNLLKIGDPEIQVTYHNALKADGRTMLVGFSSISRLVR